MESEGSFVSGEAKADSRSSLHTAVQAANAARPDEDKPESKPSAWPDARKMEKEIAIVKCCSEEDCRSFGPLAS